MNWWQTSSESRVVLLLEFACSEDVYKNVHLADDVGKARTLAMIIIFVILVWYKLVLLLKIRRKFFSEDLNWHGNTAWNHIQRWKSLFNWNIMVKCNCNGALFANPLSKYFDQIQSHSQKKKMVIKVTVWRFPIFFVNWILTLLNCNNKRLPTCFQMPPVFDFNFKVRDFQSLLECHWITIGPNHRVQYCRSRLLFANLTGH